MQARSRARIAAGLRTYRFGLGQSPFPVPTPIVESLRAHAAEKEYLPVEGLLALRGNASWDLLNAMIWFFVVRPVTQLSALADRVSQGELDAPEFSVTSRDEIGTLAESFTRMRTSVVQAMKMLDN